MPSGCAYKIPRSKLNGLKAFVFLMLAIKPANALYQNCWKKLKWQSRLVCPQAGLAKTDRLVVVTVSTRIPYRHAAAFMEMFCTIRWCWLSACTLLPMRPRTCASSGEQCSVAFVICANALERLVTKRCVCAQVYVNVRWRRITYVRKCRRERGWEHPVFGKIRGNRTPA